MKKLFTVGVVALTLLILDACSSPTVTTVSQDNGQRFNGVNQDISIITDSETGCEYIYIDSGMGQTHTVAITPLMKDATHVVCSK